MKIVKKILLTLLSIILFLILLIGVIIAINAPRNVKAMNQSVEVFCNTVEKYYTMTEVDSGEYSGLKLFGIMKFKVKQYDVEGVGNLAVMTTNIGLMQMATIVLTPTERDIPLISMDYMYMLANRTAYLEIYDLVLEKDDGYLDMLNEIGLVRKQFDDLENVTPSAAWYDTLKTEGFYKKGGKANDPELIEMLEQGLETIMVYGKSLPILDADSQIQKAALQKTYSDGLIDNGGISTDIFVKALGTDETRRFFDSVLFKTK